MDHPPPPQMNNSVTLYELYDYSQQNDGSCPLIIKHNSELLKQKVRESVEISQTDIL